VSGTERGNFLTPLCCHSSTADPTLALGLPAAAHDAPLKSQRSPFPRHICSNLLVIASTKMAILPVGKEGWKQGQHNIASLVSRSLGVCASTVGLQNVKNCESVMVSVTRHYWVCSLSHSTFTFARNPKSRMRQNLLVNYLTCLFSFSFKA